MQELGPKRREACAGVGHFRLATPTLCCCACVYRTSVSRARPPPRWSPRRLPPWVSTSRRCVGWPYIPELWSTTKMCSAHGRSRRCACAASVRLRVRVCAHCATRLPLDCHGRRAHGVLRPIDCQLIATWFASLVAGSRLWPRSFIFLLRFRSYVIVSIYLCALWRVR